MKSRRRSAANASSLLNPPDAPPAKSPPTQIKVLVLADHPLLCAGILNVLQADADIGLVGSVATIEDAIATSRETAIDVVLLDADMLRGPLLAAIDTLSRLSGLKVLILASSTPAQDVIALVEHGASGVLLKGAASGMLPRSIRAVRNGEYWIERAILTMLVQRMVVAPARRRQRPMPGAMRLTQREREIVAAISEGCSNRDVAERYKLSADTVKHHLTNIFDKTGTGSRLELALFALQAGLTDHPST